MNYNTDKIEYEQEYKKIKALYLNLKKKVGMSGGARLNAQSQKSNANVLVYCSADRVTNFKEHPKYKELENEIKMMNLGDYKIETASLNNSNAMIGGFDDGFIRANESNPSFDVVYLPEYNNASASDDKLVGSLDRVLGTVKRGGKLIVDRQINDNMLEKLTNNLDVKFANYVNEDKSRLDLTK